MWKLTVTHVLEELFESMHRLPFNYKNRSRLSRRLSRFDETQDILTNMEKSGQPCQILTKII